MSLTKSLSRMQSMLAAIQNPQQALSQQMIQQLIRENPQAWSQAQDMLSGKSHKQQVSELRKLYQSKGMDLDTMARRYGVTL